MLEARSPPNAGTLILLSSLSVLSTSLYLPSLPAMATEFAVDYSVMSWSISGYLALTAVLQLILGPLSDRYGRRPVVLFALGMFTLASFGCALATSFEVFLGFRLLQGTIVAGFALSRAIVRDRVAPVQAASMLGYIGMAMAIAPMVGPMIGGVLDALFGWRANFWVFTLVGGFILTLCWIDLGETNQHPSETLLHQIRSYPELLASRRFWAYSLCIAFSVGAFYSFLAGAPLVVNSLFNLSQAGLGLVLGSITGGFFIGSFVSGRYSSHFELINMIISGRIVACAGLLAGLILYLLGSATVYTLVFSVVFVGFGNGLTMPGCSVGVLSVRPRLAGSASGLSGAIGVGGGALITFLTGVLLNEANAYYALLAIMLASSLVGLLSAAVVRYLDHREATGAANSV